MFRSAVFKLTAWYVGALMLVCLLFSLPMYNVSSDRLRRGAVRQTEVVRDLPNTNLPDRLVNLLELQREKQLAHDRHELIVSLLLINSVIIGVGAYFSYLFARRTLRPIEEAHAAQTRFTANASHELRTPLAIMQTEIEVALRNKKLNLKDANEILSSNLEEVARLRHLSDQLLGLTRTDSESIKLIRTDLLKLVNEQIKIFSKRYSKEIKLDNTSNKLNKMLQQVPVPGKKSHSKSKEQRYIVQADKLLLSQVMGIIVENAFTYSGLDDPKVTFKLDKKDDQVLLTISNIGKTISRYELNNLFNRFYRGPEATKVNPKGHGLGLSLAKDIINRHGGEINASSKSGKNKGVSFTISLPELKN